jgi:hypothetical protein
MSLKSDYPQRRELEVGQRLVGTPISWYDTNIGFIELCLGFVLGAVFYFDEFIPRYRRDMVGVRFFGAGYFVHDCRQPLKFCEICVHDIDRILFQCGDTLMIEELKRNVHTLW